MTRAGGPASVHERADGSADHAVQPHFFGGLYGLLHRPRGDVRRETAIVLCAPVGHEYIRCHRSYRQLAGHLARAGFPVLRFDYSGTGDSTGDFAEATVDRWVDDIVAAANRAQTESATGQVALVGVRHGGTLALLAARRRRKRGPLALWDPVVSAERAFEEWWEQHAELELQLGLDVSAASLPPAGGPVELMGYRYAARLADDLRSIDLRRGPPALVGGVLVLENGEPPQGTALRPCVRSTHFDHRSLPSRQVWRARPYEGVVATESIEVIVSWMMQQAR